MKIILDNFCCLLWAVVFKLRYLRKSNWDIWFPYEKLVLIMYYTSTVFIIYLIMYFLFRQDKKQLKAQFVAIFHSISRYILALLIWIETILVLTQLNTNWLPKRKIYRLIQFSSTWSWRATGCLNAKPDVLNTY